ncbi:uncharacterized protein SETTUDRAFT_132500 [Exserohilum turcica Et28A]|uniref:F-box domain-containing protein n=1 Tax=Exserohilum turcicum (strain 28A) TaxID=671987 RepID=R0IGX5_EXST2|nr:uncharacterized protein SETTUDRAFT_132500 [Exserohilum turcica Et28A]EOA84475.1 hypothetical protein SETTUDRAFT_132500 [Exserohilum turcica Et28A]
MHTFFTSPARSHPDAAQAKELPLHLIHLILSHLDHVGDLARVTRTSRLFYYMTLPRLYEHVTLHAYSEIRYIDGRPEGYGNGSPFAMGLNTLVSRSFGNYIQTFRVLGDWREHDLHDYKQGRVPDNSMVLQVAMRAALDRMNKLKSFAWQLNTPLLQTVYEGLMGKASLVSLTIRCQARRTPRPTTIVPPLPNLQTLVVYDLDPLCYPDDISLLMLGSKKLENLTLHWSPRMRAEGEESVNLLSIFGRCIAARYSVPIKRLHMYNLYTRLSSLDFHKILNFDSQIEATVINCGGSDPSTVFTDTSWKVHGSLPASRNLKMIRSDNADKDSAIGLGKFTGLERIYIISNTRGTGASSKPNSTTPTPSTPSNMTPSVSNGSGSANGTPKLAHEQLCRSVASDYLAAIQTNHRTVRHLLLSDCWILSDDAIFRLCQLCPNLEQLGFASSVPALESLRQVFALVPKLWVVRFLMRRGGEACEKFDLLEPEMHAFAMATELWRPEYKNIKYVGFGHDIIYKLGDVYFPPKSKVPQPDAPDNSLNARRAGPIRKFQIVSRESVQHIEIWGMDTIEFDPAST